MGSVDTGLEELVRRAVRAELSELLPRLRSSAAAPAARVLEQLLTIEQVAKTCRAEPATVRGWCLSGRMVARKAGRRWVVHREDLERFLVDKRASARPPSPAGAGDELVRKVRAAGGGR